MLRAGDVPRTRLLEMLADPAPRGVFITAGAGTGKSQLLRQISAVPRRVVVAATDDGRFTVPLPSPGSSPVTVIVDDVDELGDDALGALAALLDDPSSPHQVVTAGPVLPAAFTKYRLDHRIAILEARELFFDSAEVTAVAASHGIADDDVVDAVVELTAGWPAAVDRIVQELADSEDPNSVLLRIEQHPKMLSELCDGFLRRLDDATRGQLNDLLAVPFFDRSMAAVAGGDALVPALTGAGVPLVVDAGDWFRLPPIARSICSARTGRPTRADLFHHLASRGREVDAVRSLADSGEPELAVEVFESLSAPQLHGIDPKLIEPTLTLIAPAMRASPRALLYEARLALRSGRPRVVADSLDNALDSLTKSDPGISTELHVEVLADKAFLLYQTGELAEAERLLDDIEPYAQPGSISSARARLLDARAGVLSYEPVGDELEQAALVASEAIALWRSLNDHARAAATTRMLTIGILAELGRHDEVVQVFDEQLLTGRSSPYDRAMVELFRGRSLLYCGRPDDAAEAFERATVLGDRLGLGWLTGYIHWSRAIGASFVGDAETVMTNATLAEAGLGGLLDTGAGTLFRREMGESYARCGAGAEARAMLALASASCDLDRSTAVCEARIGDPTTALELLDALELETVPIGYRWTIDHARFVAYSRLGKQAAAIDAMRKAQTSVAEVGQPSLIHITEPPVDPATIAEPAPPTPTAKPATVTQAPPPHSVVRTGAVELEIRVLGDFAMYRNGKPLTVIAGNPGKLLKLLALHDGHRTVDQLVDSIWPDVDLVTGRSRIRNVVNRARGVVGDELILRSGDLVRFDNSVGIDLTRSLEAAQQALANADHPSAFDTPLATLARPLLPADQYEPWVDTRQLEVRFELLRLYDRQFELGIAEGALDYAVEAAERAIAIDPLEERRLALCVESLTAAGDRFSAMRLQQRAEAIANGDLIDLR